MLDEEEATFCSPVLAMRFFVADTFEGKHGTIEWTA
jgi:hypothetical protein